jgi:hypothetical protein
LNLRRFFQIYAVAGLLALAIFWAFYSQRLLKKLEEETLFRSNLYASYIRSLASPETQMLLENILFEEIVSQVDFPVVITDADGNPQSFRNVPDRDTLPEAMPEFIEKLDREHEPIPIRAVIPTFDPETADTTGTDTLTLSILHYGLPTSWTMLQYFPLIQISFIVLFVILGFVFIFASSRREQERLWVALARETAHQLGTPVSSLLGWSELIRPKLDEEASREIGIDLERIKGILDRFARIGDKPRLEPHEIEPIIKSTVDFMQRRAPSRVKITGEVDKNLRLLIDPTLISWTLENLIRNSIDAIGRKQGSIIVQGKQAEKSGHYEITVTDTGPGIQTKHAGDIFRTGFSSKKHGWGIGLALSRRVIEQIHHGKLKVKSSKPGKTVLSILLKI